MYLESYHDDWPINLPSAALWESVKRIVSLGGMYVSGRGKGATYLTKFLKIDDCPKILPVRKTAVVNIELSK